MLCYPMCILLTELSGFPALEQRKPSSGGARDTVTVRTASGKTASVTYNARATYSKAAVIGMRDDGVVAVGADAPARVHRAKTILSASLDNLIVLH